MPSSPLLTLHQLLRVLDIPIYPPTLSTTTPSLLLLLLETLLGHKLALPSTIRLGKSRDDELAIVKCVLGVLADDLLAMDLTIIDPIRVVKGSEDDISVIVFALVIVARRRNFDIDIVSLDQGKHDTSHSSLLDQSPTSPQADLPPPITPDLSSPTINTDTDVFGMVINPDDTQARDKKSIHVFDSKPAHRSSFPPSSKTVLQDMMEEFGLELPT